MTFSFTRQRFQDTIFQDVGLYMHDCVKYDLYEDKVLVGMLITSRSQTYAKFRDGQVLSHKRKYALLPSTQYILKDELGTDFAKVRSILFSKNEVQIRFAGEDFSYKLSDKNIARNVGPHNLIIEIVDGIKSVFILNEYEHRKFSSNETTRPMAGIIEFNDTVDKDKMWGFLLAVQKYFWSLDND